MTSTDATTRTPVSGRRRLRRPHRRGAIYLAVLGSSLLVAMIGISAIVTSRAIHRAGEATQRSVEARYLAHAAVELGMHQINNDPNWRSSHVHGKWATRHDLGSGKLYYRLHATTGSDLQSPADGHVYLEGEGLSGGAYHRMRVTLQPASQLAGMELARNPVMKEGTRYWRAGLPSDRLEYTLVRSYSGEGSLRARNLTGAGEPSLRQDVSDWLESGETYRIAFAVHLLDQDRNVHVRFIVNDSIVATRTISSLSNNTWSAHTVDLSAAWSGAIGTAWLEVAADQPGDFLLDAVSVTTADAAHRMVPVPGTWRQVVR